MRRMAICCAMATAVVAVAICWPRPEPKCTADVGDVRRSAEAYRVLFERKAHTNMTFAGKVCYLSSCLPQETVVFCCETNTLALREVRVTCANGDRRTFEYAEGRLAYYSEEEHDSGKGVVMHFPPGGLLSEGVARMEYPTYFGTAPEGASMRFYGESGDEIAELRRKLLPWSFAGKQIEANGMSIEFGPYRWCQCRGDILDSRLMRGGVAIVGSLHYVAVAYPYVYGVCASEQIRREVMAGRGKDVDESDSLCEKGLCRIAIDVRTDQMKYCPRWSEVPEAGRRITVFMNCFYGPKAKDNLARLREAISDRPMSQDEGEDHVQ